MTIMRSTLKFFFEIQGYNGGAPVISWFRFAPVTIVICVITINHSYWSYVHQPSYRLGASHCMILCHQHLSVKRNSSNLRELVTAARFILKASGEVRRV